MTPPGCPLGWPRAAILFVNHLGPVYSVNGALGAFTLIGLLSKHNHVAA